MGENRSDDRRFVFLDIEGENRQRLADVEQASISIATRGKEDIWVSIACREVAYSPSMAKVSSRDGPAVLNIQRNAAIAYVGILRTEHVTR